MAHLIEEKKMVEKQIGILETPLGDRQLPGQANSIVSPDILRLLDLLARIEIRRQTRQQLADKEKAS
ncbi:MAG TPA: hypothetical protein VFV38_04490 [Ktedonobacteraceae bacterium]|nr:hypothetical protein [Ktedonobacteraceae bacterium]